MSNTAKPLATQPLSPSSAHWVHQLADGTHVLLRAIGPDDAELERRFLEALSPESRRMRFFGQFGSPDEALVHRMVDVDQRQEVALVALLHREGEKREIGVARYAMTPDGRCECAVAVADEWQKRGLATLLMKHLVAIARDRGVREMFSLDEAGNVAMRALASDLGFTREPDPDDVRQVVHRLRLD